MEETTCESLPTKADYFTVTARSKHVVYSSKMAEVETCADLYQAHRQAGLHSFTLYHVVNQGTRGEEWTVLKGDSSAVIIAVMVYSQ